MSKSVNCSRVIGLGFLSACLAGSLVFVSSARAAVEGVQGKDAAYAVKATGADASKGAVQTFEADNPAIGLRLSFTSDGLVVAPSGPETAPWSLDLRIPSMVLRGSTTSLGTAKLLGAGNTVGYDLGAASMRFVNTEDGVEHIFTVPIGMDRGQTLETLLINLSFGDVLQARSAPYFVDLFAGNERVLRYGAIRATDANGKVLRSEIVMTPATDGTPAGAQIVVDVNEAVSPIEVHAGLVAGSRSIGPSETIEPAASKIDENGQIHGIQIPMTPPVTETVDDIMAREKYTPPALLARPRETHPEFEPELHRRENPLAPISSHWPISFESDALARGGGVPLSPQTVGTSFKGVNLAESGFIPPDSMGDIGPTQVLFHENGRIKVFNRAGTLGSLNATDLSFWTSVDGASQPSDPEVRYDRLTGRWIIMAMNTANPNNKVMIAWTAANATITGTASFTFVSFQGPLATAGGDGVFADCLLDYPSFGIDNNAIYIGGNMFCGAATTSEAYVHSNLYVIPKSTLFGTANGGTVSATAFYNINNGGAGPGPFAPMGVDSDDPQTTTGYFIGDDVAFFSQLDVIKVSNPGGTPTIGSTIQLVVPRTVNPILQASNGSTTSLDTSDTRLIKAEIHKNKITGASTLWTAHHTEVNTSGVATSGGGRNGARWYEFSGSVPTTGDPLGGTIFLRQAGTLFDSTATNPKGYIYPSVVETGQGHMALGATSASNAASSFPSVSVAGRFRTDTLGTIQTPTVAVAGAASYTNVSNGRNRWGDYSFTDVDPLDDQTVWTFQEYADASNSWAVQAIQLKAPAPAAPASSSNLVCTGRSSTNVTITGTSASGTEFFDPGPDTGGPGYTNHIAASLAGGTAPTVNSITFVDPTHVKLNLNTTSATTGAKNVTITNPDGQSATGTGILTVVATCTATLSGTVTDSGTGLGINGATVTAKDLTTTTSSTGAYSFTSIPAGTYAMTVTAPGYSSGSANATVTDGNNTTQNFSLTLGVSDSAACSTDTSEVDFEAGTVSNLDTYSTPGSVLVPTTLAQTDQGVTSVNLVADTISTTQWRAQSFIAGVTGNLTTVSFVAGWVTSAATVTVEVHSDSANTPGALITGATANTGTISTGSTAFNFTLALGTPAPVVSGTRYWLVFKGSTSTLRGFVTPACVATCDVYANGVHSLTTNSGTSWTAQSDDLTFTTYVIPTSTSGTLISSLKDANPTSGNTARWSMSWTGSTVASTTLQFQAAASNSANGPFTFVGPGGSTGTFWTTSPVSSADMAQFNGFRYFKYKIIAGRTAQNVTPTVNDVTVCFSDGCQGAANGSSCNDNNPCTQTDTCQSNVCVGSNPVSCSAGDQCNLAATCNIGTGVCSSTTPKSSGTACNGAPGQCEIQDTCNGSGTCVDNGFKSSASLCTGTSQGGQCDNDGADHCSGTSNTCVDVFQSSSFTCRNATGQCDAAETCTGTSGACPPDLFQPNGTTCTDGNACTSPDTCQGGVCQPGSAVVCNDNNPCTNDSCSPATGCVFTNNTASCNDNNACTTNDTCSGGTCVGGPALNCNDNNVCTDDSCNPASGCVHTNNTASCSDNNACTTGDVCSGGSCQPGSALNCDDGNPCTDDSCNPSTGCVHTNNTASCSDGNACTVGDVCGGGTCHPGSALNCNDSNPCTDDSCNPASGCVYTNNTASCDDGNACTVGDACSGGACQPGAARDCNDNNPCTDDSCNPSSGCVHTNNTASCNDGNACTSNDTCSGGTCSGTPITCNDNNPCTDDSCNPATGCVYTNNTTSCDDGNACTVGDVCSGGVCQPGAARDCNDNNPCTDDSCNPSTGCVHVNNTDPCSDGNACTSGDVCGGGTCHPGAPVVCNDNNPCTDDSCNPSTGCVYTNNTSPCDDGNACTFGDTCGGGVCHPGAPVVCNDHNPCTDDSCNPATGCVYTNNTSPCDDGNACTDNDTCGGGVCNPGTPHVCDDNNPCTDDSCNPSTGCVYTNNTSPCDDGNACTDGDTCGGGVCNPGTPHVCNDNNPCTDDSCNPATGCVYVNNTAPCDDGNACTVGDVCGGGTCHSGTPTICNDNNPCTDDACNPTTGLCVYIANDGNSCDDGNVCTNDACSGGTCVHTASGSCGATGSVFYYRTNDVPGSEPTSKPVPQVGIDSNNDATADATTGTAGTYSIPNLYGHVTLAPLSKYGTPRAADHNGALTSLDASFIARGIVGSVTLSPNQRLAGDVTGNGTLSSLDASQVARFAVGLVNHFDVATNTGSDWKFLRCDAYAYPGDPGCGAAIYDYNPISGPVSSQNFYAILYGEVTGNWQPATAFASSASRLSSPEEQAAYKADQLAFEKFQEATPVEVVRAPGMGAAELTVSGSTLPMKAGERRQLTINLKNADGILALDLALKYDTTRFAIVGVDAAGIGSGLGVAHADAGGMHKIAAYGVLPLAGSGSVMTVTIEARTNTARVAEFSVSGTANEGRIPLHVGTQVKSLGGTR